MPDVLCFSSRHFREKFGNPPQKGKRQRGEDDKGGIRVLHGAVEELGGRYEEHWWTYGWIHYSCAFLERIRSHRQNILVAFGYCRPSVGRKTRRSHRVWRTAVGRVGYGWERLKQNQLLSGRTRWTNVPFSVFIFVFVFLGTACDKSFVHDAAGIALLHSMRFSFWKLLFCFISMVCIPHFCWRAIIIMFCNQKYRMPRSCLTTLDALEALPSIPLPRSHVHRFRLIACAPRQFSCKKQCLRPYWPLRHT